MSERGSGWRFLLLCGWLWGLAVVIAETPTLPVGDLSASDFVIFVIQELVPWLVSGLVWAGGARLAEDHGKWVLLALLPISVATTIAANLLLNSIEPQLSTSTGQMLRDVPIIDVSIYFIWTNMFYGYLYVAGYLVARRRMRARALLAIQRREQSEADSALREARLTSLRGQLQPDLLVDALQYLQQHFADRRLDADQLFETIVAFLRSAMPGVRNEASVLSAEFETVRRYATLRRALGRPTIAFHAPNPLATNIAFPPLVLLPLIDSLSNDGGSDSCCPHITTDVIDGSYRVTIVGGQGDSPIAAALDALDLGTRSVGGSVKVLREKNALVTIIMMFPLVYAPLSDRPFVQFAS